MNKKWSYAAAIMLTASCGSLFTGCIDNDEPYGIEQIRLSTADLLKAKQAAVAAEAAAAEAAAEVAKLEVELKKTEVEIARIKAEAEAEAVRLEAEANAAKTQAEADLLKAQAQEVIEKAKAEAYAAQKKADTQAALAQTKIDEANFHLNKLKEEWEAQKIHNIEAENDMLYKALSSAYQSYIDQLGTYNDAYKSYADAQRQLLVFESDLVWVPSDKSDPNSHGHFESPEYEMKGVLEKNVHDAQMEVDLAQSTIDSIEAFNKELEEIKTNSDLNELLAKYEELLKTNTEELAQAEVDKEAIYLDNKALYDSRVTLSNQIEDAVKEKIAIDPYTYQAPAKLAQVPGFEAPIEIVPDEAWTYTLVEAKSEVLGKIQDFVNIGEYDGSSKYDEAKEKYENNIESLQSALLDENDKAWTQARINEMTRQLENADDYNNAKANWELAKKAYNNGGTPDVSVLPYQAEVQAAVDAYNNSASEFAALRKAVIDADAEMWEASTALETASSAFAGDPTSVQNTYNAAVDANIEAKKAADEAHRLACEEADNVRNLAYDNAKESVRNANRAEFRAEQELNLAKEQNNYNEKAEAVIAAQLNYDNAVAARKAAETKKTKDEETADNEYVKATNEADAAYLKALHAADEALDKAHAAYVAAYGGNEELDPAYAPVAEAYENWRLACQKYEDAYAARNEYYKDKVRNAYWPLNNAAQVQANKMYEMGSWSGMESIAKLKIDLDDYLDSDDYNLEFPIAESPALIVNEENRYINIYEFLVSTSRTAYGELGINYDVEKDRWESDEAFLIDVDKDVIDGYIKAECPKLPEYKYYKRYNSTFGLYGQILYLENRIAVGKAYIANNDLIPDAIKPLQDNLAALEKSKTDAETAVLDLEKQYRAADEKIDALEEVVNDKIADLEHVKNDLGKIINKIESGIYDIQNQQLGTPEKPVGTIISENEKDLRIAQGNLDKYTNLLAKAQYQLNQYNSGDYSNIENPYQSTVDLLKAKVEVEQAKLDFLKARVDELQARYDNATNSSTESTPAE